jgi:hypothetical protein
MTGPKTVKLGSVLQRMVSQIISSAAVQTIATIATPNMIPSVVASASSGSKALFPAALEPRGVR